VKLMSWQVRADVIRKLNRTQKEPGAGAPGSSSDAPVSALQSGEDASF